MGRKRLPAADGAEIRGESSAGNSSAGLTEADRLPFLAHKTVGTPRDGTAALRGARWATAPWVLATVHAILAIGVITLAYFYHRHYVDRVRAEAERRSPVMVEPDFDQLYAPVKEYVWMSIGLAGILVSGTVLGVNLLLSQQRTRLYLERGDTMETLRGSESRFRLLLERILDGVVLVDEDWRICEVNEATCEALGYTREEFLNHAPEDFYPEQEREAMRARITRLLDTGDSYTGETVLRCKDGRILPVEAGAVTLTLAGKRYVLASFRDITDRKMAEAQRDKLITELESQNTELERFSYMVSHDLKSPLITIKGYVGLLKEDMAGADAAAVEDDLARITKAVDKMEELLAELLQLSRIGRTTNLAEDVPLNELATEAVALVSGQLNQRGAEVEIAPDLPVLFGDRARLLNVLQNLIDNAAKYLGDQPHPRIQIGARAEGADIVCYVADNGTGIDARYHERIFGLFEKLDPKSEGSGIGLALVKRIVEVHGGHAWVESAGVGHGSTFCFALPSRPRFTTNLGQNHVDQRVPGYPAR